METPEKVHYRYNPATGENAFPCRSTETPTHLNTTDVLDRITCPVCSIALAHQAVTQTHQTTK